MLNNKNSLIFSRESFEKLTDYENLSIEDFKGYVNIILEYHKFEFGINVFHTEYLLKYKGKEKLYKKEIVTMMAEFVNLLYRKQIGA